MAKHTLVPIKTVNKESWGDLSAISLAHEIVGETVKCRDQNMGFQGGHRVRLYYFKKNVHWRPVGEAFDITDVAAAEPARKRQRGQR